MLPNTCKRINPSQAGSMLVIALFVIIVLTLLAGTMINVISNSSKNVVTEVYGLRVQQAAKAGLQALTSQSLPVGGTPQTCSTSINSPLGFENILGMSGCRYTARCTSEDINYLGISYRYYKFTSTGFCQVADDVFSRTVSVDSIEEL